MALLVAIFAQEDRWIAHLAFVNGGFATAKSARDRHI